MAWASFLSSLPVIRFNHGAILTRSQFQTEQTLVEHHLKHVDELRCLQWLLRNELDSRGLQVE